MSRRPPEDQQSTVRRAAERARLTAHRNKATWGERLVPLETFRQEAARCGRQLSDEERQEARNRFFDQPTDPTPVEGPFERVAVFGGVYSNSFALTALLDDAGRRGADAIYCLGDLGGFGPHPDRIWPLLEAGGVRSIQGNYEQSLADGQADCNCGYTDPRDNHFADLSYRYTADNTSQAFAEWMGALPQRRRLTVGDRELLLVHGSPRRVNEFLFESTSPVPFLESLLDREMADGFLCTHTGLPWHRHLPSGRHAANIGVIGRPPNDGRPQVRYGWIEAGKRGLDLEIVELAYDHRGLARAMRREDLPAEFIETILTGWWTTCLEVLPAKERSRSRY